MQSNDQLSVIAGKDAMNGTVKHAVQHEDSDLRPLQTSQKVLKEKLDSASIVDDGTVKNSVATFTTAEKSLLHSCPEKFLEKQSKITEQLRNEEDLTNQTFDGQKSHTPDKNESYSIKLDHRDERKIVREGPAEHEEEKIQNSNKSCDIDTHNSLENSPSRQTSGPPESHTFSRAPSPTDEGTAYAGPTEHDESEKQEEKIISVCSVNSDPEDVSNNGWALKSTLSKKFGSLWGLEVTTLKSGPTEHDEHALPREPTENDDSGQFYDPGTEGGQGDELSAADKQSPSPSPSPSPEDNTPDTHQNRKDLTTKTQPPCESSECFSLFQDPPLPSHPDEFTGVISVSFERPAQQDKVCAHVGSDSKALSFVVRVDARGGENEENTEWQRQLVTGLCHMDELSWTGPSDCQRKCTRAQKQQSCREDRSDGDKQQCTVTRMKRSRAASNNHQPGPASQGYSQRTRTSTANYSKRNAKNRLELPKVREAVTTSRKNTHQFCKFPVNSKDDKFSQKSQPGGGVTPNSDVNREKRVTRNLKHTFKIKRLQGAKKSGKINSSNNLRVGSSRLFDDNAWARSQHPQFGHMHASSPQRKPDPTGRTCQSSRGGEDPLSHSAASSFEFQDRNPRFLRAMREASEIKYLLLLPRSNARNSLQSRPMLRELNRHDNRQQHPSEANNDNDYNNSNSNDSNILWQYELRNIHSGSSPVQPHDTNHELVPRGLLSETGCSSVRSDGPLSADFHTCRSQAQLPASPLFQPESDNFDVDVHREGPSGRRGETPACPNALRAVRLRRQAVWADGWPAVNLQTVRTTREGTIVDLQTLDVDMHSPLHEAEQGNCN